MLYCHKITGNFNILTQQKTIFALQKHIYFFEKDEYNWYYKKVALT